MEPECRSITKQVLPAVRASVAQRMHDKYGWTQARIGKGLGVVQVAVSKYLNHRYSKEVLAVKEYIEKNKLVDKITAEILEGKDARSVGLEIDRLCEYVVEHV